MDENGRIPYFPIELTLTTGDKLIRVKNKNRICQPKKLKNINGNVA